MITRSKAYCNLKDSIDAARNQLKGNIGADSYKSLDSLQKQLAKQITDLKAAEKNEKSWWFMRWWDGRKIAQAQKLYILINSKMTSIFNETIKTNYQDLKVKGYVESHPENLSNSKQDAEQKLTILTREHAKAKAKLEADIKLTQEIIGRHEANIRMHKGRLEKGEAALKLLDLIDIGGPALQEEMRRQSINAQGNEAAQRTLADTLNLVNLKATEPAKFKTRKEAALEESKELKTTTENKLEEYAKVLKVNQEGLANLEQELKNAEASYAQKSAELKKIIDNAEASLKDHKARSKGSPKSDEDKAKLDAIEERMKSLEPKVNEAKAKIPELKKAVETLERENALFSKKLAICRRIADENQAQKVIKELDGKPEEAELHQFALMFKESKAKQEIRNKLNADAVQLAGRLGQARKALRDAEAPLNEWNKLEAEKKSLS